MEKEGGGGRTGSKFLRVQLETLNMKTAKMVAWEGI